MDEIVTGSGGTRLHVAAAAGDAKPVQTLLEKGANPDARDYTEYTPLHRAAENGCTEAVKVLLENGADPACVEVNNRTALDCAARYGHMDTYRVIFPYSAHQNFDITLQGLSRHNQFTEIEVLLEKGARVDSSNKPGHSPLHIAAEAGHLETVQILLAEGANPNAIDKAQYTPLHHAANNGYAEAVKVLLDNGADPACVEANKRNALDCAASHPATEAVISNHLKHSQPPSPPSLQECARSCIRSRLIKKRVDGQKTSLKQSIDQLSLPHLKNFLYNPLS